MISTTRRSLSMLAAFAVAAGALALPVTSATQAATVTGPTAAVERLPSLVDLDATRTGSITIHKFTKDDTNGTTPGNGLEDGTVTGTGLDGATFTVEKLKNIDLTTSAGWEKLAGFGQDTARAKADGVDTPIAKTTTAGGVAAFTDLKIGAYIVTETATPATYVGSKPFIITVPITHPTERDAWVYNVHAYPKNAKVGIDKTVADGGTTAVGSAISYTITADVPDVPELTYYSVVDQYDKRVDLPGDRITVSITGTKDGANLPLAAGADYKLITADGKDGETSLVTLEFTEAGRARLVANRKDTDTKIQVTLAGTLKEKTAGKGLLANKATLVPNQPANGWDPASGDAPAQDQPSAAVVSKFAKVTVTKTSSTEPTKKLAGAQFEVYKCTPTVEPAANFAIVNASLDTKVSVAGQTTFTTDTQGTTTIDGLRNNDWENNEKTDKPGYYCLVETKAPDGYELQTRPIAFQILEGNSTEGNAYTLDTTITNAPKNGGFNLPLTGAAGIGVMIGAGALLVGGAGAITLANKRRKEPAQD